MGLLEWIMGPQANDDLRACESVIQRHMDSYREAGAALKRIRDERLYRRLAENFEGYLKLRWQMDPTHANRLIAAEEVARNLTPTGVVPKTERAARALTKLEPAEQLEAWAEATTAAAPSVPTSKHVEAAVAKRTSKSPKGRAKTVRLKVPGAIVVIEPGKGFVNIEEALFQALTKVGAAVERLPVKDAA